MREQPRHSIVAIVPCNDIEASTSFYVRLGLSVRTDHGGYRILSDGRGWLLHLSAEAPEGWILRGRNPNGLYLYLKDVDGLASRVADLTGGVSPEHTMEIIARESSGGATPTNARYCRARGDAPRTAPCLRTRRPAQSGLCQSAARKDYTVGLNLSQSRPDPTRSSMRSTNALRA